MTFDVADAVRQIEARQMQLDDDAANVDLTETYKQIDAQIKSALDAAKRIGHISSILYAGRPIINGFTFCTLDQLNTVYGRIKSHYERQGFTVDIGGASCSVFISLPKRGAKRSTTAGLLRKFADWLEGK